jgi:hypothetical protein
VVYISRRVQYCGPARRVRPVTMNDDLNAAKGIIYGILLSLPFWLLLLILFALWELLGS